MRYFNSTKRWITWWKKRKIDWAKHYMNPNHPHRGIITNALKSFEWLSLIEVGCGAGANLYRIVKDIPGRQVGGVDINEDAIAHCSKTFPNALLKVNDIKDIMLSDKSTDVMLSDMVYIYITPRKIGEYIEELRRLTRNQIVLCELHSTSWWNRFALKWNEGLNAYDWKKLLEKYGFYDIVIYKIPKEAWPESDLQQKFYHIIIASVPKYY